MNGKTLSRLDAISAGALLLWAGAALGFAFLAAPVVFKLLPSRDLAGQVMGTILRRLDFAAWFAFGIPLVLSFGSRWMQEIKEDGIGPLRLWSAATLAALTICLASAAIITPKIQDIRSRMGTPIETLPEDAPDRLAHRKAHGISRQMLALRVLLALGLAVGTAYLPKPVQPS
jgi:hypothetical protein